MNRFLTLSALACLAVSAALLTGCGPTEPAPQPEQEHHDEDGHDHDHEGHDHEHHEGDGHEHHEGDAAKPGAHDHSDVGPNGGHLIELGKEDYHAELVHDDKQPSVSLFLLAADAKSPVATQAATLMINLLVDGAPKQFELAAAPLANEEAGRTSRFQSSDESLWKLISGEGKLSGRFNVSIDGKPFVGAFEHEAHDHQAKSDSHASR